MKPSHSPASVTIVAMLVLSLTILNAIRAGSAIARWDLLQEFAPRPGPLYVLLTGLVWAAAGGTLFICLGYRQRWTRAGLTIAGLLYAAYTWADRLLFQVSAPRANGLFSLTITITCLAYLAFVVWGPPGRIFFDKREGHD